MSVSSTEYVRLVALFFFPTFCVIEESSAIYFPLLNYLYIGDGEASSSKIGGFI